jgi:hypothetical protein
MISIHYKETDFGDVDELVNFSLHHEEKRKALRLPFPITEREIVTLV